VAGRSTPYLLDTEFLSSTAPIESSPASIKGSSIPISWPKRSDARLCNACIHDRAECIMQYVSTLLSALSVQSLYRAYTFCHVPISAHACQDLGPTGLTPGSAKPAFYTDWLDHVAICSEFILSCRMLPFSLRDNMQSLPPSIPPFEGGIKHLSICQLLFPHRLRQGLMLDMQTFLLMPSRSHLCNL